MDLAIFQFDSYARIESIGKSRFIIMNDLFNVYLIQYFQTMKENMVRKPARRRT